MTIGGGDAQYAGNFEYRGTFYMSGGTITSNKTNGFYNSGGDLVMAGGRIVANPSVTNAFYHSWYSSMTFLDTKDCISGTMGYDPTVSSALFRVYYGTVLNLYDDETGYPIEPPSGYFYKMYDYNGMKLVPISGTDMSFSMQGYESGPYAFEPITDAQQVRNIYLYPYRPRTVSEDYLTIQKGTEKTIDINLGKYINASDYAIIGSNNESVASVSHTRLDQNGQVTVTAVNSGYANINVTFKGGNYDTTKDVSVYVPYECNVEAVNKPSGATIDGTKISATVPYSVSTQRIDIVVSEGARWTLYSDANCWDEIKNSTMSLSVGENTSYIEVLSRNYESKVYALTITRAAYSNNNNGDSGGSSDGDSSSGVDYTATNPAASAPATGPVTANDAAGLTQKALEEAKQAGDASATIRFKNVGELSLEAAQAMMKSAGSMPLKAHADSTLNNGAVDVRISFNPAQVTKNVNLSASTVSSHAQSIKSSFAKWFSNKTQVVSFAQQGDWGMSVEAAVKLDKELDAKTLVFYSYDSAANTYKLMNDSNYWVDANGYVHFTTTVAGDIIITDKPLSK